MSKHIFTIEVECDDEADYLRVLDSINEIGEITDESSDFSGT